MTVTFSTYALEAMGFRDLINRGGLIASFMSVTVYEVRGITLPENFAVARESRVAGASYRIALSDNVNAGTQCLISDDFVESESEWLKEVKTTGPFVLIAVGPTDFIECEAGRMMRMPDNSITTYDSFPSLRENLKFPNSSQASHPLTDGRRRQAHLGTHGCNCANGRIKIDA